MLTGRMVTQSGIQIKQTIAHWYSKDRWYCTDTQLQFTSFQM